jgi:hypothetical protein
MRFGPKWKSWRRRASFRGFAEDVRAWFVAWQPWRRSGRGHTPTDWTLTHITADERRTLCGVQIPSEGRVFRISWSGGPRDECQRCMAASEKHDIHPPARRW